jgi:type I restriction enzyme M protein
MNVPPRCDEHIKSVYLVMPDSSRNHNKSKRREGKIQLINATGGKDEELIKEGKLDVNRFWEPNKPRSLGSKRKQIAENGEAKGIGFITKLYGDFEDNEFVKIMPNEFFGYWRVTVEQPQRDEKGQMITIRGGKPKPETALRDYENIPFLRKDPNDPHGKLISQSIEDYFEREVKPHLPDAWIDESKTKTGYEINFTKYFYEFKPLRFLAEIKADILALEQSSLELEKAVLED